jgi:predicted RNase H-like HicB family nuclease
MPRNRVVRGGVEPPTFRFSGVPSSLGPRSRRHRASPAHRHSCWSMGLHRHHSDRAAVCRVVPFRLWASGGEPSGSKDLWGFCGARQGTDGHGACAGCGELRQSSRNPAAIKSGQKSPRKANKRRAPVLLVSAEELPFVSSQWRPDGSSLVACGGRLRLRESFEEEPAAMTRAVHVPYTVEQDEDGIWCAHAQLRPGVGANGEGDTAEAAVADLREALEGLVAEFGAPDELTLTVDVA